MIGELNVTMLLYNVFQVNNYTSLVVVLDTDTVMWKKGSDR